MPHLFLPTPDRIEHSMQAMPKLSESRLKEMRTLPTVYVANCPLIIAIVALIFGFLDRNAFSADDPAAAKVEIIDAKGAGLDIDEAKNDACRDAVRQVVGTYVASTTRIENNDLIEDKVVSLSSGFVEKFDTLDVTKSDGLVQVRIRATVRVSKVLERLNTNRIAVKRVDGASLGARLLTRTDQQQGIEGLVNMAFGNFPATLFKAESHGEPRLGDHSKGTKVTVIVTVLVEPDLKEFLAGAMKLDEAFKATNRPHGKFDVDMAKLAPGMNSANSRQSAENFLVNVIQGTNPCAISFADGRAAFPDLIQRFPLSSASGERLMEPGRIPVMFPVNFRGEGQQSTWHWYGLTPPEAKQYVAPLFGKSLTCKTTLLDDRGEELALDTCEIKSIGIGGMKYWEDWQVSDPSHQAAVAVAPAILVGNAVAIEWVIPKFTFERAFVLGEQEVRRISEVRVALE
jgi:hypothetical protein